MIDLEELERLAKEATPGPWQIHKDHQANFVMESGSNPVRHISIPVGSREWMCDLEFSWKHNCSNAAYITAACNAVPDLIQLIRELEAEADCLADRLACHNPNCDCGFDVKYWRNWAREKRERQASTK